MSPLLKKRRAADDRSLLRKYCLVSGLLAAAVMMFTYLCHDNTLTLGENTVLRMDLYHQYGPLFAELYDRIVNGYSLIYSWTSGLGGPFLGNFYNYCCSPFSLVILLTGHINMPEAIAVVMLLNAAAASMTFTYYVNKTTESVSRISVAFGLLYAFSGYFVAYSWNIMWLDAMAAFPLVILGIEKIIRRRRPALYLFAMTYTMITNYYMAYMVCILSALYFLYYYFSRHELGARLSKKEAASGDADPYPFASLDTAEPFRPAVPDEKARVADEQAAALKAAYDAAVSRQSAAIDAALDAAVEAEATAESGEPGAETSDGANETASVTAPADNVQPVTVFADETQPVGMTAERNDGEDEIPTVWIRTESGEPAAETTGGADEMPSVTVAADELPSVTVAVDPLRTVAVPTDAAPSAAGRAEPAQETPTPGFTYRDITEPLGTAARKDAGKTKKAKKRKEKRKLSESLFLRTGLWFAGASVLSFLLSAFALLPVYYCLQTSSATGGTFPENVKTYFNLFDFVANHLPSLTTTIRSSGDIVLPNVYCGLISVMLLPLYFFSGHISGRKKIAAAVFIGVFYVSFSVNYFNYIWHGFHMPNDLPYRYSFAYSFLLLAIGYEVFRHIGEFSNRAYVGVGVGVIAFTILLDEITSPNVQNKTIMMTLIFAVVYAVFFGLLKSKRFERNAVLSLLIIAVITEICVGDVSNFVMQQPKKYYVSDYDDYQSISRLTEENENELFYRTELTKLRARMDPCWYGYRGVSTFSSMAYEHVAKLMDKLGMFGNDINSYTYYPQTPVFNTMFAMKYLYDNNNLLREGDFYRKGAGNDTFTAYEYKYFLPLAFAADGAVTDWNLDKETPFQIQNDLMEKASGVADVLIPVYATDLSFANIDDSLTPEALRSTTSFTLRKNDTGADGRMTITIEAPEDGYYYVCTGSTHVSSITFTAEDNGYSFTSSSASPFTLDLGFQHKGAQILVEYCLSEDESATLPFSAARLDQEAFEKAYDRLKDNGTLAMESFDETSFSGRITVKGKDRVLYTSIPYDESWSVYLDGERVSYASGDIVRIGDALIGVKVSSGEHTVAFRYNARGLSTGMKLTAFGILIVALGLAWKYFLADKIGRKKQPAAPKR